MFSIRDHSMKLKVKSPAHLKKGDKIAIVAPAGKVIHKKVEDAKKVLDSWNLNVILGSNLFNNYNQYAAKDEERLTDLQQALDDPTIKAILFARGGYGVIRILDGIDFSGFRKKPKWLIGFSDITIFHSHLHSNYGIQTLHAVMTGGITDALSAESLRKALFGQPLNYEISQNPQNHPGKAKGILVGGNLAILCSLIGTRSDIETIGKILFIEDVGEYLYRLDRMMWQLKRAGKLTNLKGLIIGGMTDMKDNETPFGKTAYEIIAEAVKDFDYPVCFGFPAGHQSDNRAMIMGRQTEIIVDQKVIFRQK